MVEHVDASLRSMLLLAGKGNLPEPVKREMIKDLRTKLQEFMITAAMERLDEKSLEELKWLALSGASLAEKAKFLRERISDLEHVYVKAISDFESYYLGGWKCI